MIKAILVAAAFSLVVSCQSIRQPDAEVSQELRSHMDRYVALFNAADAETIGEEIYAVPTMFVDPATNSHTVLEATDEVQQFWQDTFTAIKSKGWRKSVIHELSFRMSGSDMAIASLVFSRLRANGDPIPPAKRRANYIFLKTSAGWRIIFVSGQPEHDRQVSPDVTDQLRGLMGRYIGFLNGDTPAADVSEKIWMTPRISRSFLGAREHSAMMQGPLAHQKLDGYLTQLKAQGLHRFTIDNVEVHMASKDLAFVDLFSERLREDGSAIPPGRTGFTYVWLRKSAGWRMVATLAHGDQME